MVPLNLSGPHSGWKTPLAYERRSLSETERRSAQIEKGMLAVVNGRENVHCYTYRRKMSIVTDHKLLVVKCAKHL